jgi:pilus assembly protein CpaF
MSMFSDSLRAFLKPVVPFLDDPEVSEVLINGPREVWVERRGKLYPTDAVFTEEGLLAAARNMAQYVGRPLSEERPRLDARLPDGSRIHVVLPPVARRGTTISIRKFMGERLNVQKLLELRSLTPLMARFLQAVVGLELNVVVAGGTGSGKTSLLNAMGSFIGEDERILTIEDSAELQMQQRHLVTFESRPPDKFGKGAVDIGDLLHSALRLRPDRIIVGEVRGGEAFHLLQAMNTGHGGSLTSAHANSPVDTLRRLESLCLLSGIELPLRAVRAQVASAVHLVVCCARLPDGSRKVTYVSEVLPLDANGEYRVQDLFVFVQTGRRADGTVEGHHAPTGLLPTFFPRLLSSGFADLDAELFHPASQGVPRPASFAQGLADSSRLAPAPAPGSAPRTVYPIAPGVLHDGEVSGAFALAGTSSEHTPLPAPAPTAPPASVAASPPAPARADFPPLPLPASRAAAESNPGASGAVEIVRAPPPPLVTPQETPAFIGPAPKRPGEQRPVEQRPVATQRAQPTPTPVPQPRARVASPADTDPDLSSKRPQPPAAPVARSAAPREPEASVQLDPEMAAEVERSLPTESTLITRNPLLDRPASRPADEDTHPGRRAPKR